MDAVKRQGRQNPKDTANVLSRIFFIWVYRFVYEGTKNEIDDDDIARPMTEDLTDRLGGRLERRWFAEIKNATKKKKTPSLVKAMMKEFFSLCSFWGVIYFTNEVLTTLVRPYCLGLMLTYFAPGSSVTQETALIAACSIVVINFLCSLLIEQYYVGTQLMGLKMRAACVSLIYRKCLRLSLNALGDSSPGQIVNLVSNDVSRYEIVTLFLNSMWAAPLVSLILMVILYFQVGYPGLIGIAVLFIVAPIQSYTGKLSSKYRLQIALRTDERIRLTNEVICGMQVIKMYAWEKPYIALVNAARKMELKIIQKTTYIRTLYMAFNMSTTRMAIFCALLTIVLSGGELNAQMVFMMTAYFSQLSLSMTGFFVRGFAEIAECLVSTRRLQTFLLKGEYKSSVKQVSTNELNGKNSIIEESLRNYSTDSNLHNVNTEERKRHDYMIELNNVDASWNPALSDYTLKNIDLRIRPGGLTGVIGTVGSGKSSLLHLLLGEIPICNGEVLINGTVSYAAQEPWIFAGSIRQNILFGQAYDSRRYHRVTNVCALERDFQLLPRGDMTLVGERGASLSGGQRARINLARTVYKQADIYLLDDPLSAVDTHVGNHLFKDCIEGFLRGKTTVLVTHQLQHLVNTNSLVFLKNGMIEMQGSYHDLQRSGNDYISDLSNEENQKSKENEEAQEKRGSFIRSISRTSSRVKHRGRFEAEETEREPEHTTNLSGKELYFSYVRSGIGYCYMSMIVIFLILAQALASLCDYWVSYWVRNEELRVQHTAGSSNIWPSINFSYVHGGIVLMLFLTALFRGLILFNGTTACSKGLHSNMVKSVVGTSMSFFHNNPSGRILNRFSKDLGSVDELLPRGFLDAGQAFAQIFGSLIVAMIVNPWLGIPTVTVCIVCLFLRKTFLKTSKNLKRIEGVARSPVYSHLNATLQGLPTIRAHNAQKLLNKEFDNYQDFHTGATFMFYTATGGFAFALDTICNVYLAIATLSFLFFQDESYGANAGLTITQSLAIAMYLQWGMRQSAEIVNQMTSTERLIEYAKLEPEEDKKENKVVLPKDWPLNGLIEMQHVFMKYDHDDNFVLKDVNLIISPGEKVGIVGRTGAGKSSLITALFRFVKLEGLISIDGVDTSKLTLETLRSHISIIPQEPVLFSGTLRRNLDPFERFTDPDLWQALEEVEMKDNVSEIEGFGLGSRVMDGGSNFSVGQRQLICLARAILRNNKIIVLDEATANVDPQTDALIQSTIRHKFSHCTVLTIAHRLNTIMDSDKVLVMDSGTPVEFDHPFVLLNKKNGSFHSLVHETGKSMALHLAELAKENYDKKKALKKDS